MANHVLITPFNTTIKDTLKKANWANGVIETPLTQDITLDLQSSHEDMMEGIPIIGKILNMVNRYASIGAGSGTVSKGTLDLKNQLGAQRWQMTQPVEMSLNMLFYTSTDAKQDVYIPASTLAGMSIITVNKTGEVIIPGISWAALKAAGNTEAEHQKADLSKTKLVSISVPGIVQIKYAIIKSARPTFSKDITESGFPLWATVDLQVSGIYSADTSIFSPPEKEGSNLLGAGLKKLSGLIGGI